MHLLKLGILIAAAVAAIMVPVSYVEHGPTVCVFKLATDQDCPGCGMTRAVSCALHGRFVQAWKYNRLVVVVLPLLACLWIAAMVREWRGLRRRRTEPASAAERGST